MHVIIIKDCVWIYEKVGEIWKLGKGIAQVRESSKERLDSVAPHEVVLKEKEKGHETELAMARTFLAGSVRGRSGESFEHHE